MTSNRGSGWVGWVIFFVLVFGSRLLPPVANWLAQLTGLPITSSHLVIGLIILSVVGSFVGPFIRGMGNFGGNGDTSLPTGSSDSDDSAQVASSKSSNPAYQPPAPGAAPPTMQPQTRAIRISSTEQRLPDPPRFEPIIDPRLLIFGVIGLSGLVALVGVAFLVMGI